MRIGEEIEVTRLPSGMYMVVLPDNTRLVGEAASTVIALAHAVFHEEAQGLDVAA